MIPLNKIKTSGPTALKRIGFYDSGIGGLSVLRETKRLLPECEYLYVADDEYAPYGDKDSAFIIERGRTILSLLESQGCQMIVVACNTATAAGIDQWRQELTIPLVGVEPYLNALNKHPELKNTGHKTLVMTTVRTSKSDRFLELRKRLDPEQKLIYTAMPGLASLIEQAFYNKTATGRELEQVLEQELSPLKKYGATHAILGCTHYPLIQKKIEQVLQLRAISPCQSVAQRVKELAEQKSLSPGTGQLPIAGDFSTSFAFYSSKEKQWKEVNFESLWQRIDQWGQ